MAHSCGESEALTATSSQSTSSGTPAMSTCVASFIVPYVVHNTRKENKKVHTGSTRYLPRHGRRRDQKVLPRAQGVTSSCNERRYYAAHQYEIPL